METKGDPYMKTPDDELSFIVRHSLDVFAFLAACLGLSAWLTKRLLGLVIGSVLKCFGLVQRNSSQSPRDIFTKVKGI